MLEPMVEQLDEEQIEQLEQKHSMKALWPQAWRKVRTAGSDDHGLLNIGRTWTEFPPDVTSVEQVLDALRKGRCWPGGQAGSSVKLAHNFFGVGMRYYINQVAGGREDVASILMKRIMGEKTKGHRLTLAAAALKWKCKSLFRRAGETIGLVSRPRGSELFGQLLASSAVKRLRENQSIVSALKDHKAALGEHDAMFRLVLQISRDISQGILAEATNALDRGELGALIDLISTIVTHHAMLTPYYFALFHQNQELHLLGRLTGRTKELSRRTIKVGLFTDSVDGDVAGRFAHGLAVFADEQNLNLQVQYCGKEAKTCGRKGRYFQPQISHRIAGVELNLPPILEVLEWADRQQFDCVIVNTPGAMGLCGWLVSRMLRVPMLGVYHQDLGHTVLGSTGGDYRLTAAAKGYASWLLGAASKTLVRSHAGSDVVQHMEIPKDSISVLPAISLSGQRAIASPGVSPRIRLACPGEFASEQEAKFIVDVLSRLGKWRKDLEFVSVGTGPFLDRMAKQQNLKFEIISSNDLAGTNLLLWPNAEDINGQTVLDAQAMGIPALVGHAGAGKEFVDEDVTGKVLPNGDVDAWVLAAIELLSDEKELQRLGRTARQRAQRAAPARGFNSLWETCLEAALEQEREHGGAADVAFSPDISETEEAEV